MHAQLQIAKPKQRSASRNSTFFVHRQCLFALCGKADSSWSAGGYLMCSFSSFFLPFPLRSPNSHRSLTYRGQVLRPARPFFQLHLFLGHCQTLLPVFLAVPLCPNGIIRNQKVSQEKEGKEGEMPSAASGIHKRKLTFCWVGTAGEREASSVNDISRKGSLRPSVRPTRPI